MSFRISGFVLMVGLVLGCATGSPADRDPGTTSKLVAIAVDSGTAIPPVPTVPETIESGGAPPQPPEAHSPRPVGLAAAKQSTDASGTTWLCTEQKMSAQANPEAFTGGNGQSETIYPGALLQGKTLGDDPQSIPLKRGGGKIYANATNGTVDTTEVLDEVTASRAQSAQNAIVNKLNQYGGAVQDPPTLDVETFDSMSELQANLKVGAKVLGAQLGVEVGGGNETRKSRVIVLLRQRYYRLVFEPPTSDASGFFHPSVTSAQVARFVQPGNPAVYVSSVTYGRLLYVLFESDASKSELRAAVSASFGPYGAEVSSAVRKTRATTRVKIFPVGGTTPADAGSGLLTGLSGGNAFEALAPYIDAQIRSGSTFDKNNPAAAIEYTVKDVLTRTTVSQDLEIEYTRKDCRAVVEAQSAKLWLDATDIVDVDAKTQNKVRAWPSKTTTSSGELLNAPTRICGTHRDRTINGLPAVRFADTYGSGVRGLSCDFASNRNYTVATVVQGDGGQANATLLASLKGDLDGQWFRFGSNNNSEWFVDHRNVGSRVFSYDAGSGPKLVMTTFEPGARTWVNGVEKVAVRSSSNPEQYFTGNTSCALGVPAEASEACERVASRNVDSTRNGWGTAGSKEPELGRAPNMLVGEVVGFDRALRQAERRSLECKLAQKWSIAIDKCKNGEPEETY